MTDGFEEIRGRGERAGAGDFGDDLARSCSRTSEARQSVSGGQKPECEDVGTETKPVRAVSEESCAQRERVVLVALRKVAARDGWPVWSEGVAEPRDGRSGSHGRASRASWLDASAHFEVCLWLVPRHWACRQPWVAGPKA